nr:MAG TPA: hypothetical protein [Caudoviricetes sp.]DAV25830.1 MAG TPA: hypothetical protein [Caudoviricetes sp.]
MNACYFTQKKIPKKKTNFLGIVLTSIKTSEIL